MASGENQKPFFCSNSVDIQMSEWLYCIPTTKYIYVKLS